MLQGKALSDPAAKMAEKKKAQELEDNVQSIDMSDFSLSDFKALSHKTARLPGPFEGYPLAKDINIDGVQTSQTFIVGLNPTFVVHQDPSNPVVDGVRLVTYHSRIIPSMEQGRKNVDVVFDRELKVKDGIIRIAIVKEHSVRAQLIYSVDNQGRIKVDNRYVLMDTKQAGRLRNIVNAIARPVQERERLSMAISGESGEHLDDLNNLSDSI